jgi:predicted Rossmann-fold nucleotide-binding protein
MKFYIASSFKNINSVREMADQLKYRGFTHTYDWTINDRASTLVEMKEIGHKEKEAVMKSDFVIIILPGGKGTHIELGIALGLGKRIYLFSPNEDINDPSKSSTFYQLPEINKYVGNIDSFIENVVSKEKWLVN